MAHDSASVRVDIVKAARVTARRAALDVTDRCRSFEQFRQDPGPIVRAVHEAIGSPNGFLGKVWSEVLRLQGEIEGMARAISQPPASKLCGPLSRVNPEDVRLATEMPKRRRPD